MSYGPAVRKLCRLILAAGLLAAAAAGPAQAKDTLAIGITQFPSTFHPDIDSMLAKSYILAMAQRPFTTYDENWELKCLLCTELPTLENGGARLETTPDGKEGMAVTYRIQPDAAWGDGTPVTVEDVLFTWHVGQHPQSGFSEQEFYRRVYDIGTDGKKTFTLHVDKVFYDYNALQSFQILPAHIERAIFEANPAEYRNRTAYVTNVTNPGLYFGPYRIVSVTPGSHVALEPNPTWWGTPPAFKRVTVRVIENAAALEANLLSGGIDMIAGELGVTIDQAIAFEKRHGEKYNVIYKPGLIYEHIDLNLANPILADVRVRRALLHGIDRKAISEQLFGGRQPVAHTNVNPLDWVYAEDVPHYAHDTETAKALLDEAGWSLVKGGVRHNAKGDRLALEIMTTAGNRSRELVEQVLQSHWRRIGIDVSIRNQPARVFFGETVTKRQFSAMAMFAWISAPEGVPRTTLHSDHIPTAENNWAGQNYTGYASPEMDRLIEAIEVELDREKRKALWSDLQVLYATELPVLPLYFRAEPYILPKWLHGVTPTGHLGTTALEIEKWRPDDASSR